MIEVFLTAVHISLAIAFFYILNWIGRHTVSLGYLQLTAFVRQDEAPAFNFILRTVSPTIYIIILSALLYSANEENLISGIWRVVLYYFVFRALYNIAFSRAALINWKTFVLQALIAISLSFFVYTQLILTRKYIVPDVTTLANQLWLIIILFLYAVLNGIRSSEEGTRRRKTMYITDKYSRFQSEYGDIVDSKSKNWKIRTLAYGIMIYENFGRPPLVRKVENAIPWKHLTRGIMQVKTNHRISDRASVTLAVEKLNQDYEKSFAEIQKTKKEWMTDDNLQESALRQVIVLYNKDVDYVNEVQQIVQMLNNIDKAG
jgi:hypothetical protein